METGQSDCSILIEYMYYNSTIYSTYKLLTRGLQTNYWYKYFINIIFCKYIKSCLYVSPVPLPTGISILCSRRESSRLLLIVTSTNGICTASSGYHMTISPSVILKRLHMILSYVKLFPNPVTNSHLVFLNICCRIKSGRYLIN